MCAEREELITQQAFIDRLEHYVNIDTPSGDKKQLDFQGQQLRQEFIDAGCDVTVHERPGGNLLECRMGHGKNQILLLGHMDTVFPVGTVEQRPFSRQGDTLYGPGVLDMKSGDLMILEIMRWFRGRLPADWCLCGLLNCDEEVGSNDSKDMIMELARQSAACLCMEPSKPGYCTVARKGLITFRIHAKGVAAHSGVNYHLGHSAIQSLCRIIGNLYTMRDDEAAISVNIGGISGGTGKGNVVAEDAELIGEVRFYKPELVDSLVEQIEAFAADSGDPMVTTRLTILAKRPPMEQTEASRQLYELARAAAEKNGLELVGRTHGGGSDGSYAAYVGTPVVDGMGAEGEFSHTVEEYVKADTIIQRLKMCIDLIQSIVDQK